MKIEVSTVKGFQDYLPPESLRRKKVAETAKKWFELYGFLPIETPIVEFDELMKGDALPSEGEDEAVSERFRLQDRGGRNLGLRYEFTFQLARIFKENPNIKLPFKRYQIGSIFRDEPVSMKRFRQFVQCDVDIIGDGSVNAETEVLACFVDILKELKVNAEIQVNNRKLLQSLIESVQINRVKETMRILDKLGKVGEDEVKAELKKIADTNQIVTLFKLLEKDLEFFKKNAFPGAEELEELKEACDFYGFKVRINPTMTRGFSYYTGNIFEIKVAGQKETIAAGGRYDNSVGKFSNRQISAVGISFGLDRLSFLADVKTDEIPKALILSLEQDKVAIQLAGKLRRAGISCSVDFRKPGKALEWANSYGVENVVFVGGDEVGKKKFKLKNMGSGAEKLLSEAQLVKTLAKK